jgi:hypothetical protein
VSVPPPPPATNENKPFYTPGAVTSQSGSYNDEGEYSGSSTLTRTTVDEFFSDYDGDSYWAEENIEIETVFTYDSERETTRIFSSSEISG